MEGVPSMGRLNQIKRGKGLKDLIPFLLGNLIKTSFGMLRTLYAQILLTKGMRKEEDGVLRLLR